MTVVPGFSGDGHPRLDLHGAYIRRTTLRRADLARANLAGADCRGADFSNSNLSGADLTGANLAQALLVGANLGGANLTRADIRGADLTGAVNLTVTQVQSAIVDRTTKLPEALAEQLLLLQSMPIQTR